MKKTLLLLPLTIFSLIANGQDSTIIKAQQAVYVEIGGTGIGISVSYDHLFSQSSKWKYGTRLGIGTTSFGQLRPIILGELYALKGKRRKYLELGFGVSYLFPVTSQYSVDSTLVTFRGADYLWLVPRIGYRKQNRKNGNIFRIGLTPPIMIQSGVLSFRPYLGLSFGQSF